MNPVPDFEATDLKALNERYRGALMSFFLRRVRNHADAEDLTQEVFSRLAASAGQAGGLRNAGAYLFQVAANLIRERGRYAKVRIEGATTLEAAQEGRNDVLNAERVIVSRELLKEVTDALRALPQRTRTVFLLSRLENMRHREIADAFGISVSAVQKHLTKAAAHLARHFGSEP